MPTTPTGPPKYAAEHHLAYVLLYMQEFAKDPTLTLPTFHTWLHAQHATHRAAAQAQHAAAGAGKGKT